jgi:hypothetical protein
LFYLVAALATGMDLTGLHQAKTIPTTERQKRVYQMRRGHAFYCTPAQMQRSMRYCSWGVMG